MNEIQAGLTVVTVLVVPYIVQAIKTKAMTGNAARWTAIAASALCGALTAWPGVCRLTPRHGLHPSSHALAACR